MPVTMTGGQVLLFCVVAILSMQTCRGEMNDYETCTTYLNNAERSFAEGGFSGLVLDAYKSYLDNPTGPYIFCYKNIPEDISTNISQIERFVHPYLANETLQASMSVQPAQLAQQYYDGYELAVNQSRSTCCGEYFQFSLPFNQTASEADGLPTLSNVTREYVGLAETYQQNGERAYFFCACPFTGVPSGPRDNSNALLALRDGVSGSSMRMFGWSAVIMAMIVTLC